MSRGEKDLTRRERLQADMSRLLETRSPHCLSIYHEASSHGGALQRHETALNSLLHEAKNCLPFDGAHARDSEAILARLGDELPRCAKLAQSSEGLSIFCTQRSCEVYPLPFSVESQVVAGPRFFLRPLVAALSWPHRYYVVALSQNDARLILADDEIRVEVPFEEGVPTSLGEATPTVAEDQLHFHSGASSGRTGTADLAPSFHGQRPGERRKDEDIKRYLSRIAGEIDRLVEPKGAPVVLAGVPELTTKMRSHARFQVVRDEVSGNPDQLSANELAERARPCARPFLAQAVEQAKLKAESLQASDRLVNDIPGVLRAAHDGRVETLLLREGSVVWGNYDPEQRVPHYSATPDDGSTDLLNLAALQSFQNGADVFVVPENQMPPSPKPAVAILRY